MRAVLARGGASDRKHPAERRGLLPSRRKGRHAAAPNLMMLERSPLEHMITIYQSAKRAGATPFGTVQRGNKESGNQMWRTLQIGFCIAIQIKLAMGVSRSFVPRMISAGRVYITRATIYGCVYGPISVGPINI